MTPIPPPAPAQPSADWSTQVCETAADAVRDADLVILCVPVGAMGAAAANWPAPCPADALVSDVGSSKQTVAKALAEALPGHAIIPAHPVAGTERSGPDAGFASLFQQRWCIVTPPADADPAKRRRAVRILGSAGRQGRS